MVQSSSFSLILTGVLRYTFVPSSVKANISDILRAFAISSILVVKDRILLNLKNTERSTPVTEIEF